MNFGMWRKALQIIPRISKEEWDELDLISKWLIATRAAVLVMTFLSGAFAGTPALQDDTLYIGAFNDKLYALDAQTGDARWDFDGENWFWGGPAVHSDAVYATDVNGNVYAVEAETGKEIWSRTLEAKLRAGPALAAEGSTLFISSQEGTVYALDAASGSTVWSQEAEGQVLSPAVVDGTTVYEARLFGSDLPHQIIARDVENGKVLWSYPLASEEE